MVLFILTNASVRVYTGWLPHPLENPSCNRNQANPHHFHPSTTPTNKTLKYKRETGIRKS
jgi:hypothetical protein